MNINISLIHKWMLVFASACFIMLFSCEQPAVDSPSVRDAYVLRLDGKADSAKVILEEITLRDSTNARAWYELARTIHHISMGDPRSIMKSLELSLKCMDNALTYDPDNPAYLYYKGNLQSLVAYVRLQSGAQNIATELHEIESTYARLLKVRPDYYPSKLRLVELFSMLPAEMGGDPDKAEILAKELEDSNFVYGARARELMLPEDSDYETFWREKLQDSPGNSDIKESLAKILLYQDHEAEGVQMLASLINEDNERRVLYLDIARYYLMKAMSGMVPLDSIAPEVLSNFENYLGSEPEPSSPMKAWVKGQMAMINFRLGNQAEGEKLSQEADSIDPYYSRAFGLPDVLLYIDPDEVSYDFRYLSRPF